MLHLITYSKTTKKEKSCRLWDTTYQKNKMNVLTIYKIPIRQILMMIMMVNQSVYKMNGQIKKRHA